jgi:hypothetical protein
MWVKQNDLGFGAKTAQTRMQISAPVLKEVDVCTKRRNGSDWCRLDFTRLAVHGDAVKGKRIFVLGFLVVDGGDVSLYANAEDYSRMERGRSLEIRSSRNELERLVSSQGYKYVRIEGTFNKDAETIKAGRLGVLEPPFTVRPVLPRLGKEDASDIAVNLRYLEK